MNGPAKCEKSLQNLKDKVVLITGASSGIGAATAVSFAKYGCKLSLTGRNKERLEQTKKSCIVAGLHTSRIFLVTGDVTIKENVTNIVEQTVRHYNKLDILVNSAGATLLRNFFNCSIEDYDFVHNITVRSVLMMCKAASDYLIASKGNIVTISGCAGLRPFSFAVPFSVTKSAVDTLTKTMSLNFAPKGVRVNSINPSTIKSNFLQNAVTKQLSKQDITKHEDLCAKSFPIGRIGNPEEVAQMVVFLASEQAAFISGVNMAMDGGFSQTSHENGVHFGRDYREKDRVIYQQNEN